MATAFPVPKNERTATALLNMLIDQGNIDQSALPGKVVFKALLEDWQLDLLRCYGAEHADLEDGDDEEDLALTPA